MPDDKILEEIKEDVTEIKSLLKGYNGRRGLVQQVENNSKGIARLWIAVIIIAASTGTTTYGVLRLLLGG